MKSSSTLLFSWIFCRKTFSHTYNFIVLIILNIWVVKFILKSAVFIICLWYFFSFEPKTKNKYIIIIKRIKPITKDSWKNENNIYTLYINLNGKIITSGDVAIKIPNFSLSV